MATAESVSSHPPRYVRVPAPSTSADSAGASASAVVTRVDPSVSSSQLSTPFDKCDDGEEPEPMQPRALVMVFHCFMSFVICNMDRIRYVQALGFPLSALCCVRVCVPFWRDYRGNVSLVIEGCHCNCEWMDPVVVHFLGTRCLTSSTGVMCVCFLAMPYQHVCGYPANRL
jgi:hypothetical protein